MTYKTEISAVQAPKFPEIAAFIGWGFTEQGGGKYRMTGQGEQLSEVIGRRAILQGKNILEVQEPGCPTAQKNYCGLR